MNWRLTNRWLTRGFLALGIVLGTTPWVNAQDATGFLGIAGQVTSSLSVAQNPVTIRVRNNNTNRTEVTTTPSVAGASEGFFFVALSDFSGNRAAKVGDVLTFEATQAAAAAGVTPNTTTITQADVDSSLLKLNLQIGGTAVDKTPPTVNLTYNQSASAVTAGSNLTLTAAFSEAIAAGTVSISITHPTTATGPSTGNMTANGDRTQFTFSLTVPSAEGTYTVAISGAADAAGNAAATPTNNAFRVGATIAAPNVAIASVEGKTGQSVSVPVNLTNVTGTDVGGVQLNVTYPTGKLNFTSFTNGAALGGDFSAAVSDSTPAGQLAIVVFGLSANAIPNGEVVSLTFSVASTATGSASLTGSGLLLADTAGGEISGGTLTNGSVSITAGTATGCLKFDLAGAGDGKVNIFDILAVVSKSLALAPTGVASGADLRFDVAGTGDGKVNIFDILATVSESLARAPTGVCP